MSRVRLAAGLAISASVLAGTWLVVSRQHDPWERLRRNIRRGAYETSSGRIAIADLPPEPLTGQFFGDSADGSHSIKTDAYGVLARENDPHRRAVALLLVGRTSEAERTIRAIPEPRCDAACWDDLAVVLIARATNRNDETLLEALAASDRAVSMAGDTLRPAALFTRAAIVDKLGLRELARRAYLTFLHADSSSAWAVKARQRLTALEPQRPDLSWESGLAELERAVTTDDAQRVVAATIANEEDARRWSESEYLGAWADAWLRNDAQQAGAILAVCRIVGNTLRSRSGEGLLAAAVQSIDGVSGDRAAMNELAQAQLLYRRGIALNGARRTAEAAAVFAEAATLFQRAESPMALMARYFCASAAVDAGDHSKAVSLLNGIEIEAPGQYRFLHAYIARLRAVIASFDGHFEDALVQLRGAREQLSSIGEVTAACDMAARIASTLAILGRPAEAWPLLLSSLASAGSRGDVRMTQAVLHSAAYTGLSEHRWQIAHALLNLEIEGGGVETRLAEAATWRVLAAERAGLAALLPDELHRARDAAEAIHDASFREGAENETRLTEALITGRRFPDRGRELLDQYIRVTDYRGRRTRIPEVLVLRADLSRLTGRFDEAERDLRRAIALIEDRGSNIDHDFLRDTFLGKSSSAYAALADLLDSRGRTEEAVWIADAARARILAEHRQAGMVQTLMSSRAVAASLPAGTALVAFSFFPDRAVASVFTARGEDHIRIPVSLSEITQQIGRFGDAIEAGNVTRARVHGRALYSSLLQAPREAAGSVDRLIIVDDPLFDRLRFSALVQPNGRWLVEDVAISLTPSIAIALRATDARKRSAEQVLSVGNPHFDERRYPSLPTLKAAADEAREIAAIYHSPTLLIGDSATRSRILHALATANVAHFAVHAVADYGDPDGARLLLAKGDPQGDSLSIADIAAMNLSRLNTVVIAGCRTAKRQSGYGYVRSLSSAFLAAGAQNVIASLWDVEDEAGREFSVALHRELRSGVDPATALHDVQLRMLRSSDSRLNAISSWSAMELQTVER